MLFTFWCQKACWTSLFLCIILEINGQSGSRWVVKKKFKLKHHLPIGLEKLWKGGGWWGNKPLSPKSIILERAAEDMIRLDWSWKVKAEGKITTTVLFWRFSTIGEKDLALCKACCFCRRYPIACGNCNFSQSVFLQSHINTFRKSVILFYNFRLVFIVLTNGIRLNGSFASCSLGYYLMILNLML